MKSNKSNKSKRIEPWRIIVFIISVVAIVLLWASKDITEIYATASEEQIFPMVATTVAVSLLKVIVISVAVFVIKWIIDKVKTKKNK